MNNNIDQPKNMSLGKYLIIIAAALTMVIIAVLAFSFFYPPTVKPPAAQPTPRIVTDQEVMDMTSALIKAGDLNGCDSVDRMVGGVNYRRVCRNNILTQQANKNMDLGACEKLSDTEAAVEMCKMNVVGLVLKKEGGISACNTMPENLRESCKNIYWNNLAFEQKNPESCKNLTSAIAINSCQNSLMEFLSKTGSQIDCSFYSDEKVELKCRQGDIH